MSGGEGVPAVGVNVYSFTFSHGQCLGQCDQFCVLSWCSGCQRLWPDGLPFRGYRCPRISDSLSWPYLKFLSKDFPSQTFYTFLCIQNLSQAISFQSVSFGTKLLSFTLNKNIFPFLTFFLHISFSTYRVAFLISHQSYFSRVFSFLGTLVSSEN